MKTIQQLFKEGKSFSHFPFRVIYLEEEGQASVLQAGFTVSARNFKKAVDRNRIKRLMRECYRLQKNTLVKTLQQLDKKLSVFFIYRGNEIPEYNAVFEKMGKAIERLEKVMI